MGELLEEPATPRRLEDVVIEAYITHGERVGGTLGWTFDVVEGLVTAPPAVSWPFILELLHRVPAAQVLHVATGPFENFLGVHGDVVIDAVEAQAAVDPRLREALRGVWQGQMSDGVFARVVAASRPNEGAVDADGARDAEEPDPWRHDRLELVVEGPPPGLDADAKRDDAARRRLKNAVAEDDSEARLPFDGPVRIDLDLWLPKETPEFDMSRVMLAVVEVLTAVPTVILRATDVWELEAARVGAHEPSYVLRVSKLSPDQIEAATDPTDPFETDPIDVDEWLASIGIDPRSGPSSTG